MSRRWGEHSVWMWRVQAGFALRRPNARSASTGRCWSSGWHDHEPRAKGVVIQPATTTPIAGSSGRATLIIRIRGRRKKKRSRRCYRRLQAIHRGSVIYEPLFATLLAGVTNGLRITSGSGGVLADAERSDGFTSAAAGLDAGTYGLLIVT